MFIYIYDTNFLNSIQRIFRVYRPHKKVRRHASYWYFCSETPGSKMWQVISYPLWVFRCSSLPNQMPK